MHILFILENYYPAIGGVETLFKTLIDRLDKNGVTCTILTTRHHDLPKVEQDGNTTIVRYRFFSRYLFTFLAVVPAIRHARKSDFIHTTSYNAGLPASLAGLFTAKKVIITFHEVWGRLWFRLPFFSTFSKFFHFLFEQFLLRLPFEHFVAVSEFTAGRLLKHGIRASKISTIYNGIDYTKWVAGQATPKTDRFRFIYYGRLGISKGLDLLLPAYRQLSENHDQVDLLLILPYQPQSQLKYIQRQVEQFPPSKAPTVRHELPHKELMETIQSSDCVVIPSYSEGFGYTAVESMALERPIISSGQGSLKEIVGGNFIEMKDHTVDGLIQAMEKAVNGHWEYKEQNNFELEDTVNGYVELYEEMKNELNERR